MYTVEHIGALELSLHSFLTSVLDGGEWSISCPAALCLGKQPLAHTEQKAEWTPEAVWAFWRS